MSREHELRAGSLTREPKSAPPSQAGRRPRRGLRVEGELGWLRRVMVCSPGEELRRVPPAERERFLMEDVLWLERAQEQHQSFVRALETLMRAAPGGAGAEVVDLRQELGATLRDLSPEDVANDLLEKVCRVDPSLRGSELDAVLVTLRDLLERKDPALVDHLIGGMLVQRPHPGGPIFRVGPSPNVLFARDYQFVLGGAAFISSMAKPVRRKEPALSRFVFHEALGLRNVTVDMKTIELFSEKALKHLDAAAGELWIEGGDVMVLSRDTVLVGVSERTTWRGATALALGLRRLRQHHPELFPFRELCAVELPSRRAMMHLDTVFTIVDRGLALAYPPLTFPDAREEMNVVACDLATEPEAPLEWSWKGAFSRAMAARLSSPGKPLVLVAAGGASRTLQHREQWFDACNAVATGPGVAVVYRRNDGTLRGVQQLDGAVMRETGAIAAPGVKKIPSAHLRPFEVMSADELSPRKARAMVEAGDRLLVCIDGSELGRARGGPHCMTMALNREPDDWSAEG